MKFHETHFEEYVNENNKVDLHPKLNKIFMNFPKSLHDLKNLLFFGPNGTGKYTQMLKSIKKYSPTELKYEKKISLTYNKHQYFFKISDIHYEVDFSLLGFNSKLLWHDVYQQIVDIISAKTDKSGIIVCKYFHEIHSELLDNFYSYMQQKNDTNIDIKFIIITEEISFLPDNIIKCCEIINVSRSTKKQYSHAIKNKSLKMPLENITNIKLLNSNYDNLMLPHKMICNKIIQNLENINELHFLKFRDIVYDIFIYNLNIFECIWYILSTLVKDELIKKEHLSPILIKTYVFFQYYNNNYRPIYHVENYLLYVAKLIYNF